MNIYTAIMKAADWIEQHPALWDFYMVGVPECDTPGCALGWIGFFLGLKAGDNVHYSTLQQLMGISAQAFYARMTDLSEEDPDWLEKPIWHGCPILAAQCLRAYAEKYHGHDKPEPGSWDALKDIWQPRKLNTPYGAPAKVRESL